VARIFVSYRRGDTGAYAGALLDLLEARYGAGQVFMDVNIIHAGAEFDAAIERAVASADLMIVLIGKQWLVEADGRRRLEDPQDFVRGEIEAALRRNIRILPVLVGGARMPDVQQLPDALRMLNYRQAFAIDDARWRSDTDELLRRLDRVVGRGSAEGDAPRRPADPASKSWLRTAWDKLRLTRPR
jgi:TIR domain